MKQRQRKEERLTDIILPALVNSDSLALFPAAKLRENCIVEDAISKLVGIRGDGAGGRCPFDISVQFKSVICYHCVGGAGGQETFGDSEVLRRRGGPLVGYGRRRGHSRVGFIAGDHGGGLRWVLDAGGAAEREPKQRAQLISSI